MVEIKDDLAVVLAEAGFILERHQAAGEPNQLDVWWHSRSRRRLNCTQLGHCERKSSAMSPGVSRPSCCLGLNTEKGEPNQNKFVYKTSIGRTGPNLAR
jgi:hypothetical protein